METCRKKQTRKRLLVNISRGFVIIVKSLTVNSILQSLPGNHFEYLSFSRQVQSKFVKLDWEKQSVRIKEGYSFKLNCNYLRSVTLPLRDLVLYWNVTKPHEEELNTFFCLIVGYIVPRYCLDDLNCNLQLAKKIFLTKNLHLGQVGRGIRKR